MPTEPAPRVAVIGAGIAGLAAARALAIAGIPSRVFDKGRAPGGRASTRRHPPFQFDHGAQYFTVRDNRFMSAATSWLADHVIAPWTARMATIDGGQSHPFTDAATRYVGVPGMSAVAARLARDLSVRCGEGSGPAAGQVWRVSRDGPSWRLFDQSGAAMGEPAYDACIVSVPAPQAVPLLAGAKDLAAQVAAIRMLPTWAVMAAFGRTIEAPFDAAMVRNSPLAWVARDSSKPGRASAPDADAQPGECWVLHASHEWSQQHLEDSPESVTPVLLAHFAEATGLSLPEPIFTIAHRWRYAAVANPIPGPSLADPARRIVACGDWCNPAPAPDSAAGRIEAAFVSGLAAASHVQAFLADSAQ